jgi:hypothetical protein
MLRIRFRAALVAALVFFADSGATASGGAGTPVPPDDEMDAVRHGYIELRRDALVAEPSTTLPANAAVAVYVSIDRRTQATLDGVSLQLNGEPVGEQHYSPQQLDALRRGAMDRLFIGALPPGTNTLVATFRGVRRDGKPYAQTTTLELAAAQTPRYVELRLGHTSTKGAPDIVTGAFP